MNDTSTPAEGDGPLAGRVALVTGATRGAGRGTAIALGEAGATVYCTGRSTREQRSEYDRPETIEETAELVDAAGGRGIAVQVDHLQPAQVEALVERIDDERGRLDLLVNNIWGGELLFEWDTPIWEHDLENGLRLLRLAVDTHLITSHFALSLLSSQPGGLVVEMTDGTREYNADALPPLRLLRPRQDRRSSGSPSPGRDLAPHGLHGGRPDAGLAALGDDARELRGHRGQLARQRGLQPALRRDLGVPAVRRPRGRRAGRRSATCTATTAARSPPAAWRASTASPTSTARSPTAGATWSRFRTPDSRPTRRAIGEGLPGRCRASPRSRASAELRLSCRKRYQDEARRGVGASGPGAAAATASLPRAGVADPVARTGAAPARAVARVGELAAVQREAAAANAFGEPDLEPLELGDARVDAGGPVARQA